MLEEEEEKTSSSHLSFYVFLLLHLLVIVLQRQTTDVDSPESPLRGRWKVAFLHRKVDCGAVVAEKSSTDNFGGKNILLENAVGLLWKESFTIVIH